MEKASGHYLETLNWLYSFANNEGSGSRAESKFDLVAIARLLELLGNPHTNQQIVHIAGTKGKGSTAAFIANALTACGYKTALFQSPHLSSVRERFSINGQNIAENQFVQITNRIKAVVDAMVERGEAQPTVFDIMTAIAFVYFRGERAQVWIIETGLGGRLDSTNIINPMLSVITKIGLDHIEILGNTYEEIATEKGGIIKEGKPIVLATQSHIEADTVIRRIASEKHSQIYVCGEDSSVIDMGIEGPYRRAAIKTNVYSLGVYLGMTAPYQLENAETAVLALSVLRALGLQIIEEGIQYALANTRLQARFTVLQHDNTNYVLDGAHNTEATSALLSALQERFGEENPRVLVFGCSADKDYKTMFKMLSGFFHSAVLTQANHPRAVPVDILQKELKEIADEEWLPVDSMANVSQALFVSREKASGGLVCVCGSFFVASEALEILNNQISQNGTED